MVNWFQYVIFMSENIFYLWLWRVKKGNQTKIKFYNATLTFSHHVIEKLHYRDSKIEISVNNNNDNIYDCLRVLLIQCKK